MIEKHGRQTDRRRINGAAVRRDAIDSTTIPQDGMVMVTSGEDVTEDHTVSKETVPHGESIDIAGGSIQILKQAGKDGRARILGRETFRQACGQRRHRRAAGHDRSCR